MTSAPVHPVVAVAGRSRPVEAGREQAPDLGDGQRDHPGVGWRRLVRRDRRRGLAVAAVPELGCGDGADRQRRHNQDEVAEDRGIEPGLALIQAEAVLPEPEIFFKHMIVRRLRSCRQNLRHPARSKPRWRLPY